MTEKEEEDNRGGKEIELMAEISTAIPVYRPRARRQHSNSLGNYLTTLRCVESNRSELRIETKCRDRARAEDTDVSTRYFYRCRNIVRLSDDRRRARFTSPTRDKIQGRRKRERMRQG